MDLTVKLLLINQYKILERLCPGEAEHYAQLRTALERGYAFEYSDLFEDINPAELSEDQCKWVMKVLRMHQALQNSAARLEDKSGIDRNKLRFAGFDESIRGGEAQFLQYARYCQKHGLGELDQTKDLISHRPMAAVYERMLKVWDSLGDAEKQQEMSRDDIVRILNVQ